jgi:hypothetical protein
MRKAAAEFDATGVAFKVLTDEDFQIRLIQFREEFREEVRTRLYEEKTRNGI